MDTIPTWLAGILATLTAVGGAFGLWIVNILKTRNQHQLDTSKQEGEQKLKEDKQEKELRMSENEQAFKIYKDLLDGLRKDVVKMSDDMDKMEKERLADREEIASLKADLRASQRENEAAKAEILMLKAERLAAKGQPQTSLSSIIEDKPKT
jgi:uncharacterized membrane-anchored protein YhcB (DUF1043 family)